MTLTAAPAASPPRSLGWARAAWTVLASRCWLRGARELHDGAAAEAVVVVDRRPPQHFAAFALKPLAEALQRRGIGVRHRKRKRYRKQPEETRARSAPQALEEQPRSQAPRARRSPWAVSGLPIAPQAVRYLWYASPCGSNQPFHCPVYATVAPLGTLSGEGGNLPLGGPFLMPVARFYRMRIVDTSYRPRTHNNQKLQRAGRGATHTAPQGHTARTTPVVSATTRRCATL